MTPNLIIRPTMYIGWINLQLITNHGQSWIT